MGKQTYRRGRHLGTERADRTLSIRLSESDYNTVANLAAQAHLSRGAFVVECIMRPISTARKLHRNDATSNIITAKKELFSLLKKLEGIVSDLESRPKTENCDDIIRRIRALLAYINYGGE